MVVVVMVVPGDRGTLRRRRGPVVEIHRRNGRALGATSRAGFLLGLVAVVVVAVEE